MSEESITKFRPIYFQPGQLVFHAYGNLRASPRSIRALLDWANSIATSKGITISSSDNNVLGFNPAGNPDGEGPGPFVANLPNQQQGGMAQNQKPVVSDTTYQSPPVQFPPAFSLIFATANHPEWPEPVTDSTKVEEDKHEMLQVKASNELLDLIVLLDEKRAEAPVKLEVVSPNWVMSSSGSRPGGTGGPGGKPWPVRQADYHGHQIILNPPGPATALPETFNRVSKEDGGSGVVVAILDTSYTKEKLEDFYQTWVLDKLDRGEDPHPIVDALLRKDPSLPGALRNSDERLRVYTNASVDDYLPGLKMDGHDYDMTDHGLFVAGIINSLAPQAELHLYQVLNKNGFGDLLSIARALQDVTDRFRNRPLVVNLSLTMEFPLDERYLRTDDGFEMGKALLKHKSWWFAELVSKWFNKLFGGQFLCSCDSWLDRQARPLEWISDLVYALDSRIIAAAGNNSKGKPSRLPALYPAASGPVFGVGALARDSTTPASYSNLSDTPASKGIITLGGEDGPKNGILGVYMGQFPKETISTHTEEPNGWAWWSGTSFATPIVTGITAAVRSNMPFDCPVETAIAELFNVHSSNTPLGEEILAVSQG